jgi:hypothetical protein
MKKLILTFLVVLSCANTDFAQGFTKFDCSVATLNLDSPNPEVIRKQLVKEIGRFKVDGVGEEDRVSKYFRLPKTNWFIVASLYASDESMASKSGVESFNMELSLARRRKRNIFTSPVYASSEMPFNTFDIGRVVMIVRAGNHRQMVSMQCIGSK